MLFYRIVLSILMLICLKPAIAQEKSLVQVKTFDLSLKSISNLQLSFDQQYYFATENKFCANCGLIEECSICPVSAAMISKKIGIIPEHLCQLEQLMIKNRKKLFL